MEIKRRLEVNGIYTDVECDPTNIEFPKWLAIKVNNHMKMDWYTKNALWLYWKRVDNEEVLTYAKFFDFEEENLREDTEIAEIFRIETDIFEFETPLCKEFKEEKKEEKESSEDAWSNYLTNDDNDAIQGNQEWTDDHEPMEDGDDDSRDLDDYLSPNNASYYVDEVKEVLKEKKSKLLMIPYEKPSTFKSKKFKVIKYSLGPEKEYVDIKEYGYDILVGSKENVSHVYQEIFHKKDEGWSVTCMKIPYGEVILNGNGEVQMTKDKAGNEVEVPPVTAQQILARTRERKAKSTLLMAIPDEHLARL
nr:SGNH hydrolase-type esterase domain-containing protein [Tanacetum cinerariifolium]